LGIALDDEKRCLRALADAGQIRSSKRRYRTIDERVVDTRVNRAGARKLKAFWGRRAIDAIEHGDDGLFTLNLMSVSEADFERLNELTQRYFRDMRELVARSQPNERVALFCAQLLKIDRT